MSVIRRQEIAQDAHKNFGLSFCEDFLQRDIVSFVIENPIPSISTV